jgi:hypothetical protein
VLTFSFNAILNYGLQKSNNYEFKKFYDIKENKDYYSMLVLGSSRARNHYNNMILDSGLKVKTYCIGSIASFLYVDKMMFEYYLETNKPPKYMILDLNIYGAQVLDRIPFIAQYMGVLNEDIIYNYLKAKDMRVWLYRYIPLCGMLINRFALRESLESLGNIFYPSIPEKYSGYIPLDGDFYGKRFKSYEEHILKSSEYISIDKQKVNNLFEIIKTCKEKEIKLFIVFSPIYKGFFNNIGNRDSIMQTFKNISKENGVQFLDYTNSEFCYDRKYFFDMDHLNRYGAEEFTRYLVKDLLNKNN